MKILQEAGRVEILAATSDALRLIERAGRTAYQSYLDRSTGEKTPITEESAAAFIRDKLIKNGHESVIEHAYMTAHFELNSRGQTHEQVRHRLCAFTQESTRYVDESEVRFVAPPGKDYTDEVTIDTKCAMQAELSESMDELVDLYSKLPHGGAVAILNDKGEIIRDMTYETFKAAIEGFSRPAKVTIPLWAKVHLDEQFYRALEEQLKWKYQDARQHLPIGLVAEIVHSANFREWRHIFKLRCAKRAHWEIRRSMRILLAMCIFLWPPVFEDLEPLLGKEGEAKMAELLDERTKFGVTKLGRFR